MKSLILKVNIQPQITYSLNMNSYAKCLEKLFRVR